MRTLQVIIKGIREQLRSCWVLLLTLIMGPFFIFVYFLIMETSKPHYRILILNDDKNTLIHNIPVNHGDSLIAYFNRVQNDTSLFPVTVQRTSDYIESINQIKNKKADALILIDSSFSKTILKQSEKDSNVICKVAFSGDLTNTSYLISAVWAEELVNRYVYKATRNNRLVEIHETALGSSASLDDFDLIVPGILILSLIMLMFTTSIAFIEEIEHKTIVRLQLSKIKTIEFIGGISIVQILTGISSIFLTLLTAVILGFDYSGSLLIMALVAVLTSLSIVSFSLIIAAFTKSASEVLVVGNFPMFLFMFFSGAAFPIQGKTLFTLGNYPVTIQGLMSPTHAISALNKTLIMDMKINSIIAEITAILILSVLYFFIGALVFKNRHLKHNY